MQGEAFSQPSPYHRSLQLYKVNQFKKIRVEKNQQNLEETAQLILKKSLKTFKERREKRSQITGSTRITAVMLRLLYHL